MPYDAYTVSVVCALLKAQSAFYLELADKAEGNLEFQALAHASQLLKGYAEDFQAYYNDSKDIAQAMLNVIRLYKQSKAGRIELGDYSVTDLYGNVIAIMELEDILARLVNIQQGNFKVPKTELMEDHIFDEFGCSKVTE